MLRARKRHVSDGHEQPAVGAVVRRVDETAPREREYAAMERALSGEIYRRGTIGRAKDCDLVVSDKFASRKHLTIKLMRTNFYLIDHSINGTFVSLESGEEVHVLRSELLLDSSGQIMLGRSRIERPQEVINFSRDRRSMYRL